MSVWYIIFNGQQIGPMTKENIRAYNPTPDTPVWREGMASWQPLYTFPELMEAVKGMPPTPGLHPQPGIEPPVMPMNTYSPKNKTTAGILALILGGLGVQYFYLGKVGAGLITILLTFVTCGLWEILTFVQGIMMLTMTEQEFNRKYVFTDKTLPLF